MARPKKLTKEEKVTIYAVIKEIKKLKAQAKGQLP